MAVSARAIPGHSHTRVHIKTDRVMAFFSMMCVVPMGNRLLGGRDDGFKDSGDCVFFIKI